MRVERQRVAVLAAVLAVVPLGLTGCGLVDSPRRAPEKAVTTTTPAVENGAERARARVQAYLDAMKAKSVDAGRAQLCAPLHDAFDAAATTPNGDFAAHFTVSGTEIVDVRAVGADQEVSTSVTVKVGDRTSSIKILFTVARADGQWCIAREVPGGHSPTPTGAATPTG
ncbi:hypothetical protein [Plantactinospora sonchi]|uniref:DUF4878 domain-containing protein n=1 Tax=Plantactinospora sonchi TaxID=1544735 RepID=A0ABU7S0U3_9ACTN